MSWNARDLDTGFDKLQMKVRTGKDKLALFYHNGMLVTRTKRPLGKGKVDNTVRHLIGQQLKLSESVFSGIKNYSLGRAVYVQILKKKGYIP